MSRNQISEDDNRELQSVVARAARDAEFRQQLIDDPHGAIEAETGTRLPERFRIRFVEKDPDVDALVVLPEYVSPEAELTEEELSAVAGGVEEELEFICWKSCKETCESTCGITGIAL